MKAETSSIKEENREVVEINYFYPSGKPKKSQKLRFSAEEERNVLDGKILTIESVNSKLEYFREKVPQTY